MIDRRLALLALATLLGGCAWHESPSYAVIDNTLPAGGEAIRYTPDGRFENIARIDARLGRHDAEKLDRSLGWYATESSFGLQELEGKTARQAVDIVNCLKRAETLALQATCFERSAP